MAIPIQTAAIFVLLPSVVGILRDTRGNSVLQTDYLELKLRKHPLHNLSIKIANLLWQWPVNDHHIVKWYIYMVCYPLGCSHCRWVNHMHYPCLTKACFKQCPVMSRPLHLCTLEKLHDYGIMRWTPCRPSCDEVSDKLLHESGPWAGVSWGWWRRTHCVCRTNWRQDWGSCINSLLDAPLMHVYCKRVSWRPRGLILQFSVRLDAVQGVYDKQWRLAGVAIR